MVAAAGLILANRSYIDHNAPPGKTEDAAESDGGLLAAVRPVIAPWDGESGTTWIGAGRGKFDDLWVDARGHELVAVRGGMLRHRRLTFDETTWNNHYGAVSNGFFWPLMHLSRRPLPLLTDYYPAPKSPSPQEWTAYVAVNQRFADAAAEEESGASCWIHDYQLALVPRMLRADGSKRKTGFFLHTPFPSWAVAEPLLDSTGRERLRDFMAGMLGADLIGLQTEADVGRFREAAVALLGANTVPGGVRMGGRVTRLGAYPVGIDVEELLDLARSAELPGQVEEFRGKGQPLVIGLERSDYTKGIPERLNIIADAFDAGLRFSYVGVAAPTREGVRGYEALISAIETATARAAEAARRAGCHFLQLRRSISWEGVVALQRDADVVFTSSLADGMNLVPLQAAVAQSLRPEAERAVIIVGRDAGFALAFASPNGGGDGFSTVDALDPEAMRATLAAALKGLPVRVTDTLVARIRAGDARAWATRFLSDMEGSGC
ncbi:MAG TPA: trehalose-6-phosphate synthase [Tepidiformaceae bacterium]